MVQCREDKKLCSKHTTFDYYEVHNLDANNDGNDDYFYPSPYTSNTIT
jgi:hypothetical protein